jgi:hypothetical protein
MRMQETANALTFAAVLHGIVAGVAGFTAILFFTVASAFMEGAGYWILVVLTLGLWLFIAQILYIMAFFMMGVAFVSIGLLVWTIMVRGLVVRGAPGASSQARGVGMACIVLGVLVALMGAVGPWNLVLGILYIVVGARLLGAGAQVPARPAARNG